MSDVDALVAPQLPRGRHGLSREHVEIGAQRGLREALAIAREENAPLTTPQESGTPVSR